MDDHQARAISGALREIRDRVGDILKECPSCGAPAGDILLALSRIEESALGTESKSYVPVPSGAAHGTARKRNQPKRYVREHVGGNEVLSEYRDDSGIPLRAPHEIVQAVVRVLATAKTPKLFSEIQEELGALLGVEPPEYQTRTALRFLLSPDVSLIARRQARYVAANARTIQRKTNGAWRGIVAN